MKTLIHAQDGNAALTSTSIVIYYQSRSWAKPNETLALNSTIFFGKNYIEKSSGNFFLDSQIYQIIFLAEIFNKSPVDWDIKMIDGK